MFTHFSACMMSETLPSFRSNIIGVFQFLTLQRNKTLNKTSINMRKLLRSSRPGLCWTLFEDHFFLCHGPFVQFFSPQRQYFSQCLLRSQLSYYPSLPKHTQTILSLVCPHIIGGFYYLNIQIMLKTIY